MRILAHPPETWNEELTNLYKKPVISITFQVTEDCCMACTYCYQHHKTPNKMTWETAKTVIDKILLLPEDKYASLILEFIGGEPLLEIDLISRITQYTLNKLIERNSKWLVGFRVSICSNGQLYFSQKVQSFIKKFNKFLSFSVSIDGDKEQHDECRIDINGNGTYNKAINAVKHYRENYGKLTETKMTSSPDSIEGLSKAIISLINNEFSCIYSNCIFEKGWDYSHATILYNELKKLADYLIDNNLYDKIYIRYFDEELYQPMDKDNNKNWCGGVLTKDTINFSIDYKGDIYSCIRYMESSLNSKQKPLIIGDIFNGYNKTIEQKENIKLLSNITRRSQSTDKCFNCPIAEGCAWCSGYNYEEFGTPNKRATYICPMHQATSLANVSLLNKLYKQLNIDKQFKMYIPKDWALNIINEEEYNTLLELSQG